MSLIELKNITKIYKLGSQEVKALDGVSLKIEKGEFSCIYVMEGKGTINGKELNKCDHYFIPFSSEEVLIKNISNEKLKFIRCFGKEI